jgi:hypothetical protein
MLALTFAAAMTARAETWHARPTEACWSARIRTFLGLRQVLPRTLPSAQTLTAVRGVRRVEYWLVSRHPGRRQMRLPRSAYATWMLAIAPTTTGPRRRSLETWMPRGDGCGHEAIAKPRWITALVAVLLLVGCGIDKPATKSGEEQPTNSGTHASSRPQAISFDDTHEHADGVEVAVTEIADAKLIPFQTETGNTGDPYTILTVQVSNGSTKRLELVLTGTLTYGAAEEPAVEVPILEGAEAMALVKPGEAISHDWGFIVPERFQDDVVFVVGIDFEHDKSVFSGSIKPQ